VGNEQDCKHDQGSFSSEDKRLALDIYEEGQYNPNNLITIALYVGRMLLLGECSGVFFRRCVDHSHLTEFIIIVI
jgi:hypothetical protein